MAPLLSRANKGLASFDTTTVYRKNGVSACAVSLAIITGLCQNEDAPGTSERDLIFGGIACQLENDSRSVAPITRKAVRHQRFTA